MYKKCVFVGLVLAAMAGVASASTLKVNFQSPGSPVPEGYLPDYGDAYGDRGNGFSYGWDEAMGGDARDRNNHADQRYDTLNHLQKSGDAVWEIELPNGTYDIFMVCGDPSNTDQTNDFDVEGVIVNDPDGEDNFDEYTLTVELTDGRLTIKPAETADNCKICFVDLTSDVLTQFFVNAKNPNPADGAVGVPIPLFQWAAGDTAVFHSVYLSTSPDLTEADLVSPNSPMPIYYYTPGLEPGATYYWRVDEVELDGTVHEGDVWSFIALSTFAWYPGPAHNAVDVLPDAVLSWQTGSAVVPLQHALYFGENLDDVAAGTGDTAKGVFDEPGYDPGILQADTTYYWRVDQIEPDGTVRDGEIWSFETAAAGPGKIIHEWWYDLAGATVANLTGSARYPNDPDGTEFVSEIAQPNNWADQYGARYRGWIFAPETGDYTFEIDALDEGEIRLSPDADPANAVMIVTASDATEQSAPQSLVAGERYYIEVLIKENTTGDRLTASWRGPGIPVMEIISATYVGATPYLPVKAYAPNPADGAVDVVQSPTCSWSPGVDAAQHDVYFGTDEHAVASADTTTADIYKGRQAGTSYAPGELEWNATHFWRIDEVNNDGSISTGKIWSFTTAEFIWIDDFETYTNEVGSRIFQTWIDGLGFSEPAPGNPGNGSAAFVGHDIWTPGTPYTEIVETGIVQNGDQAMPLYYNNSTSPYYSETDRTFAPPLDLSANGLTDLSIWVHGNPITFAEPAPGSVTLSGGGEDIWNTADQFRFAYKRLNGDGSITARVDSLTNTDGWAKVGVMIRETLDADSRHAMAIVSAANGVQLGRRTFPGDVSSSTNVGGIAAPALVRITRTGNTITAQYSEDGVTWLDFTETDGSRVEVNLPMVANVYIGLCVTSHNSNAMCLAEFSEISTTGGVSGQYQIEDVGIAQLGNVPDQLYVGLSSGGAPAVVNAAPDVVLSTEWVEVKIPLADFAGVNLAAVRQVIIGVGNRNAPTAAGDGLVYIDNARAVKPAPEPDVTE